MNALLDHDLDGLPKLVPSPYPLHILIDQVAHLWREGITGSISYSKVRLPCGDQPMGYCLLDHLPPCWESQHIVTLAYAMTLVCSANFRSWKGVR